MEYGGKASDLDGLMITDFSASTLMMVEHDMALIKLGLDTELEKAQREIRI